MSDAVWLAIVGIAAMAVKEWFDDRRAGRVAAEAKEAAAVAAKEVKDVRDTLDVTTTKAEAKMDNLGKVAKATHTLVNNQMAVQLRLSAVALRRVAGLTGDAADVKAAEMAEVAMAEHDAKQAVVDAQPGTDAEKKGEATPAQTVGQVVGQTAKDVKEIHKVVVKVIADKPDGESER